MRSLGLVLIPCLGAALALFAARGAADAPKPVLVIHGGAGVLNEKEMAAEKLTRGQFERALAEALTAGYEAWKSKSSVDAVEAAIRVMEDCDLFNAGRGAALSHEGRAELDAAVMEGRMAVGKGEARDGKEDPRKRAGAVAGVTRVKNPISAARAVMEMKGGRHVLIAGEGADVFALGEANRRRYRLEEVSNVYFWTDRRLRQIRTAVAKEEAKLGGATKYAGTVGAVARNRKDGTLAAGTSTGGLTNKLRGRVGDSPLIGAGTYADDRACGVSCTGTGEVFIRHAVAHDVVARMLYKKLPVDKAAQEAVDELPDEDGGVGGLIALDTKGGHAFAMSPRSVGMYRGYVTEKGEVYVAVFKNDALKPVEK